MKEQIEKDQITFHIEEVGNGKFEEANFEKSDTKKEVDLRTVSSSASRVTTFVIDSDKEIPAEIHTSIR